LRIIKLLLFLFIITFLISSCSVFNSIIKKDDITSSVQPAIQDTVVQTSTIVNEMLEEARQQYISAVKYQQKDMVSKAITSYDSAMTIINQLSYYPGIEKNDAYSGLENSIIEDYKKFISSQKKLPSNVSTTAFEDWMDNNLPQLKINENEIENEDKKNTIMIGDFPLEINRYVEQYIEYFTGPGRNYMQYWLERTGKYFPMMAKIFAEENVPQQLIFLSLPESGLNPHARSWARAMGIWQFMRNTARLYDLKVGFYVDQRLNPALSTKAAALYLKDLYYALGNWYLAIAAYNSGLGRVQRAVKLAGSKDFWKVRRYLPRETRNYIPQYLAVTLIGSNPAKYGFTNINYDKAFDVKEYKINGAYDLSVLAKCAGINVKLLKEMNPSLIQHTTPPASSGSFMLKIPRKVYSAFVDNLKHVPDNAKIQYVIHIVRRGETLSGIAQGFRINLRAIEKFNNISSRTRIYPGTRLKIPVSTIGSNDFILDTDIQPAVEDSLYVQNNNKPYNLVINTTHDPNKYKKIYQEQLNDPAEVIIPKNHELVTYKVKRYDKLVDLAGLFNVRVFDIRNWNNLPYTTTIKVGEILKIYVPKNKINFYAKIDKMSRSEKMKIVYAELGGMWIRHRIKSGDVLGKIAEKYGVGIRQLRRWNNLRRNRIVAGKILRILIGVNSKYSNIVRNTKKLRNNNNSTYKVKVGDTLSGIALKLGVSVQTLRKWNNLQTNRINVGKTLKIYSTNSVKLAVINNKKNKIQPAKTTNKTNANNKLKIIYIVKNNDTLGGIAEKYFIRAKNIRKWNHIRRSLIHINQKLVIYPGQRKVTPQELPFVGEIYVVQSGDALWNIAKQYKVAVDSLRDWNNLSGNKIKAGQEIKILN